MGKADSRLLVIGAGVNGSAVAARLHVAGVNITILARDKRFEELKSEGIVIENPFNHQRTVTHVPVIEQLEATDLYDYLLVIVRKNQTFDLLPLLVKNNTPNIVFMGNNLTGPEPFIQALGAERVMMGAVFAAGKRDGSLIRAMVIKSVASPFGELDGSITPRLKRLADIFHQAGFKIQLSKDIVNTQRTHAVGVAIVAALVLKHAGKVKQLAHDTADLKLYAAARREGLQLLRLMGYHILPPMESWMVAVPVFIQVMATRWLLNSRLGEVGLEYHISQAPDEMQQLILELAELVHRSGLPFPALRKVLEQPVKI